MRRPVATPSVQAWQASNDPLACAGRAVLRGTLSLAFAATMLNAVMVPPYAAAAGEGPQEASLADEQSPLLTLRYLGKPLREGHTYKERDRLEVSLVEENPQLDGRGLPVVDVRVRNLTTGRDVVLDAWRRESAHNAFYLMVGGADGLADGTYEVRVSCADRLGNHSELPARTFCVDADAPRVQASLTEDDLGWREGACAYVRDDVALPVCIADANLDVARTEVCGMSLADLMQGGGASTADGMVDIAPFVREEGADGVVAYRSTLTLHEGSHALAGLVRAYDVSGRCVGLAPAGNEPWAERVVVDKSAPRVRATVQASPAWTSADGKGVALFGKRTSITLALEDAGGIRSATLDADSVRSGRTLLVRDDLGEATLELGEVPLTRSAVVVVADKAGNALAWTMGPQVLRTTAEGSALVPNEAIACAGSDEPLMFGEFPQLMVADDKAPEVTLEGPAEGAGVGESVAVRVHLSDDFLGNLAAYDPDQVVVRASKDGEPHREVRLAELAIDPASTSGSLELAFPARPSHEDDGCYVVEACVCDLAGNESQLAHTSFRIDTTSPTLGVSFDDDERGNAVCAGNVYAKPRTASLVLREAGVTAADLNGAGSPVHVEPRAWDGRDDKDVSVSAWSWDEALGAFRCRVVFPADGTYELAVVGGDLTGNRLRGAEGTQVDAQGRYASGAFVVDATQPRVRMSYQSGERPDGTFEGIDYFSRPASIVMEVADRNLDVDSTVVVGSDGRHVRPSWRVAGRDATGEVTYRAEVPYAEEGTGAGEGRKRPEVLARDMAGNASRECMAPFVIDQTAPLIERVWVGESPMEAATDEPADPLWFFGDQDGKVAQITFEIHDEYPLEAVWIDDPRGVYDVQMQDVRGKQSATLSVELRDGSGSGLETENEAEFRRNIQVYARDLAGNERSWSLARLGTVRAERQVPANNVTVDDRGVHPLSIVRDAVAPRLGLSGAESGAFYRDPKVVHVQLEEHNVDYLMRYDPSRTVLTVRREPGSEQGGVLTWTVPIGEFEGQRPSYGHDVRCEDDGRYTVCASLTDLAGNDSGEVRLDSFVIDRTSPVLRVDWDNDDARNGMYFRAPRKATVEVCEHNFDPRLFAIETTGVVGAWHSSGDRHTCVVDFSADAPATSPHRLVVRGTDAAGNEAQAYEAPPFALDTHAPSMALRKRVSDDDRFAVGPEQSELADGTAYAQGIEPVVVAQDDAALDATSVEVQLVGRRGGVVDLSVGSSQTSSDRVEVRCGNLGLGRDEEGEPCYSLAADDVYTLRARAKDMAGNVSDTCEVSFSVNRYGSNFYVEPLGGDADGEGELLVDKPPRLVVHEVNVSGSPSELDGAADGSAHTVTKEYALATSAIPRTSAEERTGYTLAQSREASPLNPHEGWTEYTYTIQAGNFGEGSPSDYGDGGQGRYRVDVSSRDLASHNNTTARFWESGAAREDAARDKTATAAFTLDEYGPKVEALELPGPLAVGDAFEASFVLRDDITNGDYLCVRVDGEPVDVFAEGSHSPVGPNEAVVGSGRFTFAIPAKSLLSPREVEVSVRDYTNRAERVDTLRADGFRITNLKSEAGLLGALIALLAGIGVALRRIWHAA